MTPPETPDCNLDAPASFAGPTGSAAWRPIASAPKGKAVLLSWKHCKDPSVGRWEHDGIREGWRCDGDQCVPKNQADCTHWMPLPLPPNDQAQRRGGENL